MTLLEAFAKGETAIVDSLMEQLLGRKPKNAEVVMKELLMGTGMKYTWHQNYAKTFDLRELELVKLGMSPWA